MRRVPSPAPSDRLTQAQRLARTSLDEMIQVAIANGTPVQDGKRSPAMARQIQALRDRSRYKFIDACPHLEQREPEPAYWIAAQPETLHCMECAPAALLTYAMPSLLAILAGGTADDAPHPMCVHCRRRKPDTDLLVDIVGCIIAAVHLCTSCLNEGAE